MPRPKIRILPDKVFYKLWMAAVEDSTFQIYRKRFLSFMSKEYIDFYRLYGIDDVEAGKMLENIYQCANMSTVEILKKTGKRKSEIRDMFCIHIRTLENWWGGKSDASGYIRLMFLRYFQILSLGKYIYLASEKEKELLKPPVYQKREKKENQQEAVKIQKPDEKNVSVECNNSGSVELENDSDDEFERFLDSLYPSSKSKENMDRITSEYSNGCLAGGNRVHELLEKTDYLSAKIKRQE